MTGPMRDAALDLAAAGWPVFPLRGKLPWMSKHDGGRGLHDGTTNVEQVAAWWDRWPRANIGARVPDGLFVVDVDPRHDGDRELAALEAAHGPLPVTLTVWSGRGDGGRHLYFRHPGGKVTESALPRGVDLRNGGTSYCVVPPSIHPDSGGPYRWHNPAVEAVTPPVWLVGLLRPPRPKPVRVRPPEPGRGGYGVAALSREAAEVAATAEGSRNKRLHLAAIRLGQLVAAGHCTDSEVRSALAAAAAACGLPSKAADSTVTSGLKFGLEHPRGVA